MLIGLLLVNSGLYFASFAVLTAKTVPLPCLLPGAVLGATAFTALITIGTGLVTHQLGHASATYGAFGSVIGVVAFLLLLAKMSMYAAELNPVLARSLYPRALTLGGEPTAADRRVPTDIVHAEQRRDDQAIAPDNLPNTTDQKAEPGCGGATARTPGIPDGTEEAQPTMSGRTL